MVAKIDKLTKKEKGFVKDFIKTGNVTQSARKNYKVKNDNTAASIGSENLRKPKIIKELINYADRFNDEDVYNKHLELLNKKVYDKRIIRNSDGSMEIIYDETPEIDQQAVSKAIDMIYKIKSSYAPDKLIIPTDTKTYNFYFDPSFQKNIKQYEDNLKQQILNAQTNQTNAQDVEVIE